MGRSLVSSIILGQEMRFYISAESLTPGLELEVQIKAFHREILGHVLPDTETRLTKSCIHGIDHQSLLTLYQKRVESDGRAECAKVLEQRSLLILPPSFAAWVALLVLKARLYELEKERQQDKVEELQSIKKDIGWGSQIRSYVLPV